MNFLQHFNRNRHHVTNPEGKQKARDLIKKTFQDLGLTTWSELFTEPDFFNPQVNINFLIADGNKYVYIALCVFLYCTPLQNFFFFFLTLGSLFKFKALETPFLGCSG